MDFRQELASRENRDEFDNLARQDHFVTRQDVRNCQRNSIDFANFGHTSDAESVQSLVQKL